MPRFFHLTQTFFGLTPEYKPHLLEEIYLCTQRLQNITYADVLSMPTHERRYYLGLYVQEIHKHQEKIEAQPKHTVGAKGKRTSTISGSALKSRIQSGDVPMT